MKITAAVLDTIGHAGPLADARPLSLCEVELAPPRPGELLVRCCQTNVAGATIGC